MILDGLAQYGYGNSSRGARYNSALIYANKKNLKGNCVIVVISEDGMIDILPEDEEQNIELDKQINEIIIEARRLFEEQKYNHALKRINMAIKLNEGKPQSHFVKANIFNELQRYDEALKSYSRAIELKPNYKVYYNNRGTVYKNKREYDKAIEDYSKAIQLDSKYIDAYNNRGIIYKVRKEYTKAIEDYTKAIEIDANYVRSYKNLNLLYEELLKSDSENQEIYIKEIKKNKELILKNEHQKEISGNE